MADVNGDGNKETWDGPGRTVLRPFLHRPPACTVCSVKHLGSFLSLVCRQHRLTSYSLPLKSLCICCESTPKKLPESRYFVNAAKNRTAPSWRDLQSSEMLRSSMNRVYTQQRTRVFKGSGMIPRHHTCDRLPNLMPLCRAQAEWRHDVCALTGGLCHCTNRQTNNIFHEGQGNHILFHQEDTCLALYGGLADLHYRTWDIILQNCIRRTTSVHCTKDKQINNVSSLLTHGPTAWHPANQRLHSVLLPWGTANTNMLLD